MPFELFARLVLSLGIVIGLMWIAARVLHKRGFAVGTGGGGRKPGRNVQVELLARRSLGKNTSIAVVRVGERSMIVGVTDHNVTKLDDAELDEIDVLDGSTNWTVPAGASSPGTAWKTMLEQLRARTVRR